MQLPLVMTLYWPKKRESSSTPGAITSMQVVSGFGPVFATFPQLNVTVAVLVWRPSCLSIQRSLGVD